MVSNKNKITRLKMEVENLKLSVAAFRKGGFIVTGDRWPYIPVKVEVKRKPHTKLSKFLRFGNMPIMNENYASPRYRRKLKVGFSDCFLG